jgi:hypothetical protein
MVVDTENGGLVSQELCQCSICQTHSHFLCLQCGVQTPHCKIKATASMTKAHRIVWPYSILAMGY